MTAPNINKRSSFFSNVLKLVSGTTLAQLITILTAPIISRLFAPEAFGVLNVFTSLIGIISIVICLRYEYAIMLPKDDADAGNLFALCLVIAFGISAACGLFLLVFGQNLANLLKSPDLYKYFWLIPIGLFIQGLFAALNYWNSRTKHFGRLSIARVAASLTTSALPIFLAFLGRANAASLIFSYLAGTFIFAIVLGVQVLKDYGSFLINNIHKSQIVANLKRYRKFPLVELVEQFYQQSFLAAAIANAAIFFLRESGRLLWVIESDDCAADDIDWKRDCASFLPAVSRTTIESSQPVTIS